MDWQTLAGLVARHLMTTLAGYLVTLGLLAPTDQANFVQIMVGIAVGAAGLAWSAYQKHGAQQLADELRKTQAALMAKQQPKS